MKQVEALYNTYFHDVFLFVMSLSKNEDVAEEITQETFFKAMKSLSKFKGDCDVRVWLCQIAKNTYYNHCTRSKQVCVDEIPETASTVSLADQLEDAQQTMKIHHILHELGDPYKEVFTLRVFGELSFRQIAEVFGKTESWARVTFHRAKLKIIDTLEEETK
ncbi:MAG: RNA polymerase sigma factor [Oscillospiraceae bacterium]|nr:RNA polymerase sigma factor [Ruminococcus sp.]MBQ7004734.1 RNA polymerase sigma factor [Oscillospiraceae bacterium]MBQ7012585.1 RNA polymerase sigma factor [Oscillospiraceae bacterium]